MLTAAASFPNHSLATLDWNGHHLRPICRASESRPSCKEAKSDEQSLTLYSNHPYPELQLIARGKVRDIYVVDDDNLLIVATDRLSAYDVVMPDPIPGKGEVLTALSNFWFAMMEDPCSKSPDRIDPSHQSSALRQRSNRCKAAQWSYAS